jgi:hypothetical protein
MDALSLRTRVEAEDKAPFVSCAQGHPDQVNPMAKAPVPEQRSELREDDQNPETYQVFPCLIKGTVNGDPACGEFAVLNAAAKL